MSLVFVPLLLLAATAAVAHAASSSPTPAGDEPTVNWTWLAVGLGGVIVMLVIMLLLTRVFRRRQDQE